MFRDSDNLRAIAARDNPSARYSRRISAQSSTVITLQTLKGAHFSTGTTAHFSTGADTSRSDGGSFSFRRPSPRVRRPSPELRRPSPELRRPSPELRRPIRIETPRQPPGGRRFETRNDMRSNNLGRLAIAHFLRHHRRRCYRHCSSELSWARWHFDSPGSRYTPLVPRGAPRPSLMGSFDVR